MRNTFNKVHLTNLYLTDALILKEFQQREGLQIICSPRDLNPGTLNWSTVDTMRNHALVYVHAKYKIELTVRKYNTNPVPF